MAQTPVTARSDPEDSVPWVRLGVGAGGSVLQWVGQCGGRANGGPGPSQLQKGAGQSWSQSELCRVIQASVGSWGHNRWMHIMAPLPPKLGMPEKKCTASPHLPDSRVYCVHACASCVCGMPQAHQPPSPARPDWSPKKLRSCNQFSAWSGAVYRAPAFFYYLENGKKKFKGGPLADGSSGERCGRGCQAGH